MFPICPTKGSSRTPLRSNRPKTQPPHLVWNCYNYHLNLSSDHLLSGVIADYKKNGVGVNGGVGVCRKRQ
jgi:hypothetical protein